MKATLFNETEMNSAEMMNVFDSDGRLSHNNLFAYYFNCVPNKFEIGNVRS